MMYRRSKSKKTKPVYSTKLGKMYCGNAEMLLSTSPLSRYRGKIQLIFTSPPFPLNTKKRYGNLKGEEYVNWFSDFAPLFREYLTPNGSIVIELGNAWEAGKPVMSTMPLKALLAFQEKANLFLCQEFICFNPARLPTPAQWVTVDRVRVKDAFTRVWWLSATEKPKADNRRVLTEYSNRMKDLLKKGTYNAGPRPSQHHIGQTSFLKRHAGAIPPNVLTPPLDQMTPDLLEVLPISNTVSNGPYHEYCRRHNIETHPARMPEKLVEFFVLFLAEPRDIVLDPFAGSNTTGFVAERNRRRWLTIEIKPEYVKSSKARFSNTTKVFLRRR